MSHLAFVSLYTQVNSYQEHLLVKVLKNNEIILWRLVTGRNW
jgi:hypothetical protein